MAFYIYSEINPGADPRARKKNNRRDDQTSSLFRLLGARPCGQDHLCPQRPECGQAQAHNCPPQASRRAGPTLRRSVFKKVMEQLDPKRGQLQALGAAER